ncbi:MAG: AAA family ATPase [Caulobacter sp.]|nr:AAA family ATPase [Caulobacter sp.]
MTDRANGEVQFGLDFIRQRLTELAEGGGNGDRAGLPASLDHPALSNPFLQGMVTIYSLSLFEAQLLLLVLGVELSREIAALCAACQKDERMSYATLRLAIAMFPESEWRSFTPEGPLRAWDLVQIEPGPSLLDAPVRPTEFTVHMLCGEISRDRLLTDALIRQERYAPKPIELVGAQSRLAEDVLRMFRLPRSVDDAWLRPLIVCPDSREARRFVTAVAERMEFPVDRLNLDAIVSASDRQQIRRLLRRDYGVNSSLILVELTDVELSAERLWSISSFLDDRFGPVIFCAPGRVTAAGLFDRVFELPLPSPEEQWAMWQGLLGEEAVPLKAMLMRFNLGREAIETAHATAMLNREDDADVPGSEPPPWRPYLSAACRELLRGPLERLAERIDTRVALDQLALPPPQRAALEAIIADVGNQAQVIGAFEASGGSSRGLGLTALFAGPSGTGKTTAAEAMATALDLDLYRIDLSAMISKYIGETEKQLATLFDAAERGANILLFDEADALFGKRTTVRDSHDRYANQSVSYLLQRIESYRGLAILATNLVDNMDEAFQRRFTYTVTFPMPAQREREAIWRHVFGPQIAVEALDFHRLAEFNLSGASIRSVALRAAFFAAAANGPVTMERLQIAIREEYRKLNKVMTDPDIHGGVA